MRILKYGFLGEDDAQKIFLKNYLTAFDSSDFSFEEVSNPIVDFLSKETDIEWLENRSESFRHFHGQVKLLLSKL